MSTVPGHNYEETSVVTLGKYTNDPTIKKLGDDDDEAPLALSLEREKRTWRKIDWRLLPILSMIYLLSFMDRSNIGNAKLEGLVGQLHLNGDKYNIAVTAFFISYCTLECPANLILKVFRPSRWLPGITVLWGIIMISMGFVKTYPQLVGVRFALGIAEAGLFPGITYYLTLWYPRYMLQYRIGLFFGAATVAGAFSGMLAFGINYMNGDDHMDGWSWIFIFEGLMTIAVGFAAFFLIIDFPSSSKVTFMTSEERAFIAWKKKYDNSTVGEGEHFALRHILAAFTDWQVYLHLVVYMSVVTPLYGITFFLPTIIKSFGHSVPISQLLTVPPYICAAIVLLVLGHYSDKLKIRSMFIYAGYILLVIGYSINLSSTSNGAKYFGTFFIVTGSYSAIPGVITWLGNNLAGQYKRAVGMALHIGIGNVSGAIAANAYRIQDDPQLHSGHCSQLIFVGVGMIVVPILVFVYKRINDARDEALRLRIEQGDRLNLSIQELRDMGDRAPDFRYTL